MEIVVLINKINRTYYIELLNKEYNDYKMRWSGENLLDAYNLIYSEILKLNHINNKIIFLYKIDKTGFIRYQNDKKSKLNNYLNYCYPSCLENITYEIDTLKDIKKQLYYMCFMNNKNFLNSIKLFIDSFGFKKMKEYSFDYYVYKKCKYIKNEVQIYIIGNVLNCMYYDQVGLKITKYYELTKYKCNLNEYYHEITFYINTFIRTLYAYQINKIVLHSYTSLINNDFNKYLCEIDHYQLEISDEK